MLTAAIFGFAPSVLAQWGMLRRFRVRLKTKSKSVVGTKIEARDQYEAVFKINKRYPGCTILNLKPDRSESYWLQRPDE